MSNRDILLGLIEARGTLDGRFVGITRITARGGDGVFSLVFSAKDLRTGKLVALKFFNPENHDAYRLACFEREEQILKMLIGEPDILQWVAPRSGFSEELPTALGPYKLHFSYYAAELAVTSLAAAIARGGLSAEEALLRFREACRAVQRIHARRIIHRDIKPSNFLGMANRQVRLGDFGTARSMDSSQPSFLSDYLGTWPGDKRYSAPEMLAGLYDEEKDLAYRGDVFSLGACLFELFAGTNLGTQVFGPNFADDMAAVMSLVAVGRRREIYGQFVDMLVAAHPLPSVGNFGGVVPACIRRQIDTLYQSMARLDYRQRLCDFSSVFRQIEICLIIVRNEEKIRRWSEEKRKRRQARLMRKGVTP